ncbi:MAG: hypothetical protein LUE87_03355, partial [Lachnospiraceae bacterium]|nr:hypothetical protein [Lachnospiraceae bacterium]
GDPEKLTSPLLTPNEITITADADQKTVREIMRKVSHVTELTFSEKEEQYTTAHIKTDRKNIYDMSRAVFTAFAKQDTVLLEMSLKQANLEDVFIELTEETAEDQESGTVKENGETANKEAALKIARKALGEDAAAEGTEPGEKEDISE